MQRMIESGHYKFHFTEVMTSLKFYFRCKSRGFDIKDFCYFIKIVITLKT